MNGRTFNWRIPESWPKNWPKLKFAHDDDPGLNLLVDRLNNDYDYISLYHACRPKDIECYYEEGLKVAEPGYMVSEAISVFSFSKEFSVSAFEIISLAGEVSFNNKHKLFLSLDDRVLFKSHLQRLVYGSDYLYRIGQKLNNKKGSDFTRELKKIGKPTIFDCLVPVSMLSDSTQLELSASIARYSYAGRIGFEIDFTAVLHKSLSPEYLISARNPGITPDLFE